MGVIESGGIEAVAIALQSHSGVDAVRKHGSQVLACIFEVGGGLAGRAESGSRGASRLGVDWKVLGWSL